MALLLWEYFFLIFSTGGHWQPLQEQRGVFRVNCIDSLDRTNVVQSMVCARIFPEKATVPLLFFLTSHGIRQLGRRILRTQLEQIGAVRDGVSVFSNAELDGLFKNAWADHADAISLHYSGFGRSWPCFFLLFFQSMAQRPS